MIIIYEKEESKIIDGENVKEFKEVVKAQATHIHRCGHDTNPPSPCTRTKL